MWGDIFIAIKVIDNFIAIMFFFLLFGGAIFNTTLLHIFKV